MGAAAQAGNGGTGQLLLAVAANNEYAALAPLFAAPPPPERVEAGAVFPLEADGHGLWCCVTGVGPLNAALSLGRALALHPGIDAVCAVGLAGSYDLARAPLCSAWRVTREFWPEYGVRHPDSPVADAPALGFAQGQTAAGEDIRDSLTLDTGTRGHAALAAAVRSLPAACGVTVAGVSGTPGRACALYGHYAPLAGNLPLLESMEGFALALACQRCGVPLYALRVVSNLAGHAGLASLAREGDAAYRAFAEALTVLPGLVRNLLCGETHAVPQASPGQGIAPHQRRP